jgi:hypothetical protein
MLAGVEFSACAIQMSVRPWVTHCRISSRYGFSVALGGVTCRSLEEAAE